MNFTLSSESLEGIPFASDLDSILWKVYKVEVKLPKDKIIAEDGNAWPVKRYVSAGGIRARGTLHVSEIAKDKLWIIAEVISKSINVRGMFRYLLFIEEDKGIILVEDTDQDGEKVFQEFILPTFKLENAKENRVNAMRVRKLAKNGTETPVRLTLLVNNQTAGVDGLETITLTGSNVNRGIITLKDRQEVDLKAESIGP